MSVVIENRNIDAYIEEPDPQFDASAIVYSEEIKELMGHTPKWVIRHGVKLFVVIFFLLSAGALSFRFSDKIITMATLTSIDAPFEVRAKINGNIIALPFKEGERVKEGQAIGFIESTADHNDVLQLSENIGLLQNAATNNTLTGVPANFISGYNHLGEIQEAYQKFIQAFISYKNYLVSGTAQRQLKLYQKDLVDLKNLSVVLNNKKILKEQDLQLSKEEFHMHETLSVQKVISSSDFRLEQSKLLNKMSVLPEVNSEIIRNSINQTDKERQILSLQNEINQQKNIFLQALNTLKSAIDLWKSQYILYALKEGAITYNDYIHVNKRVHADDIVAFINKKAPLFFAKMYVPQSNFGKVRTGQRVLLDLYGFPNQEYGYLIGEIEYISPIATDSGYASKIKFNRGMVTNRNIPLHFSEGLKARATIITLDLTVGRRIYNKITSVR